MILTLPIELRYPTSYKRLIHSYDEFLKFVNLMNGRIDIFEAQSIDGQETQKNMDNGNEVARKYLSNRHKDIFKGKE